MEYEFKDYLRVREIKRSFEKTILLDRDVFGCGITRNQKNDLSVTVYAASKSDNFPTEVDGIPVTVVEEKKATDSAINGHLRLASLDKIKKKTREAAVKGSFSTGLFDAALIGPHDINMVVPEVLGLGIPQGVVDPHIGMKVKKSGCRSGVTEGEVVALDVSMFIDCSPMGWGTILFLEQIGTTPMAKRGDSGSITLDNELNVVGLLFANIQNLTLHNPIRPLLDILKVGLVTENKVDSVLLEKIIGVRRDYENGKSRTERWRPVPMGVSVGNVAGGTGTTGCLVRGRVDKDIFILTNAHVACPRGYKPPGLNPEPPSF